MQPREKIFVLEVECYGLQVIRFLNLDNLQGQSNIIELWFTGQSVTGTESKWYFYKQNSYGKLWNWMKVMGYKYSKTIKSLFTYMLTIHSSYLQCFYNI